MKRIVGLTLLAFSFSAACAVAAPPNMVSPQLGMMPVVTIPSQAPAQVYLSDPSGRVMPVLVDDAHPLVGMASWCPNSHSLIAFLNDPEIKPFLKGKQMNFVYQDEWPWVGTQLRAVLPGLLARDGYPISMLEMVYASSMAKMKAEANNSPVKLPGELKQLPGNLYFLTDASKRQSPMELGQPTAMYSTQTGRFDTHPLAWIMNNLQIPVAMMMQKGKQYGVIL